MVRGMVTDVVAEAAWPLRVSVYWPVAMFAEL